MLITRKSHRPSDGTPYRSRFRAPDSGAFALRQYLRCREEFYQRIVVACVQAVFVVLLLMFGRTLHQMFEIHGKGLPLWVEIICQGLLLLFALLFVRRIVNNVRGLRSLRGEMSRLRRDVDRPDPEG